MLFLLLYGNLARILTNRNKIHSWKAVQPFPNGHYNIACQEWGCYNGDKPSEKESAYGLNWEQCPSVQGKTGLTQEELANQIDVDTSTIARIEGGTRMMSIIILCAMAEALQVSYDTLLRSNDVDSTSANIQVKLAGQSPENLAHLERIIQTVIDEYGAMEV